MAEGHKACESVREAAPSVRKAIDKHMVMLNEKSRKVKNALGDLWRFVIKYTGRLNASALTILYGMSQIDDEIASANG